LFAPVSGCARSIEATGTVVRPARLPVRTHPQIFIASGLERPGPVLAAQLAAHLEATSPSEVVLVEATSLERRRQAGGFPATSAVVYLVARFDESSRSRWVSRPQTVCGPINCYTTRRSVLERRPVLEARAQVRIFEGPTARRLADERFSVRLEGSSYQRLEDEAKDQLQASIIDAVDAKRLPVRVELPPFAGGEAALEAIARGEWRQGRDALEALVADPAFETLSPGERARGWYALGQARRFDPTTRDEPQGFAEAAAALAQAAALAPDEPRYADAQRELAEHRALLEAYRAQRERARANFSYADQLGTIPDPPASYR
jgi:hypothetical protein